MPVISLIFKEHNNRSSILRVKHQLLRCIIILLNLINLIEKKRELVEKTKSKQYLLIQTKTINLILGFFVARYTTRVIQI